ncbi:MAG: alanine racemase [Methylococcales bacterium]|nr:alanine racemase [Methylococcales bacterium]MCK5924923.1 alanine racemase [Methylococcales bacterium]
MKLVTYATIDLSALQHNLAVARLFAPDSGIIAVIKANAYGHGLLSVAKALSSADAFAVARIDEALVLRKSGFQQRIILLEGFSNAMALDACRTHNIELVIHCIEQIHLLEKYKPLSNIVLWLKIDTGMNRLGFDTKDFSIIYPRLKACLARNGEINFMTHLANADDPEDVKTLEQIFIFQETVSPYGNACSIANSAGLLTRKESLKDWVRPGLMLYGISPLIDKTGAQLDLKPVMGLYSQLIAIKTVEAGESVGYGGSWITPKPIRLGVVAIGYGDGYPRQASVGTPVLIKGQKVPIVGRISMDMLTVDLSLQPQAEVYDEVMLWGDLLPIEKVATAMNTIPYTLVCGVTARVPRYVIRGKS